MPFADPVGLVSGTLPFFRHARLMGGVDTLERIFPTDISASWKCRVGYMKVLASTESNENATVLRCKPFDFNVRPNAI